MMPLDRVRPDCSQYPPKSLNQGLPIGSKKRKKAADNCTWRPCFNKLFDATSDVRRVYSTSCHFSPAGPGKSLTFADAIKEGGDGEEGGGSAEGGGGAKKKEQKKPEPCFPPFITRW